MESYCLKNEDSTEAKGEYRKLVFDKEGEKMGRKHGLELVLDYGNRWAPGQHIFRQSRRFHDSLARTLKNQCDYSGLQ